MLDFLQRWHLPQPVVVVPTTYHTISAAELGAAGAKMVVYANHGLRAGIQAVSQTFETILKDGRTTAIEDHIAPLKTVFDLQGMDEFTENEKRFVRGGTPETPPAPAPERDGEPAEHARPVPVLTGGDAP